MIPVPSSDFDGPANIAEIQGTFTSEVVTIEGVLVPVHGSQACRFRFQPPDNLSDCQASGCGVLDLAMSAPDYGWGPSTTVGTGGASISNSVCTIHAGSGDSKISFDAAGKVLRLELDIEFAGTAKKHIFALARNKQGDFSNDGQFHYWGWW